MTTDELMKPRYKQIADYPNSLFKTGDILYIFETVEECEAFNTREGHAPRLNSYDQWGKYPDIYQRLQWWQDRLPENMPEYVKDENGIVGKLGERYSRNLKNCVMVTFKEGNAIVNHFKHWLPATKDEYDNQSLNPPA